MSASSRNSASERRLGISVEDLAQAGVLDLLRGDDAFEQAAARALDKDSDEAQVSPEILDAAVATSRAAAKPQDDTGPAVSRWKRRRGSGPGGVRLSDDFDDPLEAMT